MTYIFDVPCNILNLVYEFNKLYLLRIKTAALVKIKSKIINTLAHFPYIALEFSAIAQLFSDPNYSGLI